MTTINQDGLTTSEAANAAPVQSVDGNTGDVDLLENNAKVASDEDRTIPSDERATIGGEFETEGKLTVDGIKAVVA